jgi:hypothetical protein
LLFSYSGYFAGEEAYSSLVRFLSMLFLFIGVLAGEEPALLLFSPSS